MPLMRFAFEFPGGAVDTTRPVVTLDVAAGAIHENRTLSVTVTDDVDLEYVRIEVHYPTGYYEVAYDSILGFGALYSSSSIEVLEPMSGVGRRYTIVRDLHWPTDFEMRGTAIDKSGNVSL